MGWIRVSQTYWGTRPQVWTV